MDFTINVYDKSGKNVVKTCKANSYDIMFGTIIKLMELTKIEKTESSFDVLKTVYSAWDEIKNVLSDIFSDMEEDDWNYVKIKELIPIIIDVAKFSVKEILVIPKDNNSKN